jgi:hypothetical protein
MVARQPTIFPESSLDTNSAWFRPSNRPSGYRTRHHPDAAAAAVTPSAVRSAASSPGPPKRRAGLPPPHAMAGQPGAPHSRMMLPTARRMAPQRYDIAIGRPGGGCDGPRNLPVKSVAPSPIRTGCGRRTPPSPPSPTVAGCAEGFAGRCRATHVAADAERLRDEVGHVDPAVTPTPPPPRWWSDAVKAAVWGRIVNRSGWLSCRTLMYGPANRTCRLTHGAGTRPRTPPAPRHDRARRAPSTSRAG